MPDNAQSILDCLNRYEKITNQRVNFNKSELYLPTRIGEEAGKHLSEKLGLKVAAMSFQYLGVLISGRRVKAKEHQGLVERIDKRLAGWKRKLLSQAGKLTFINATLMSISAYWLGSTWLSDAALDEMTKKARTFLWENNAGHGLHLLNWEQVTTAKRQGDLGVRRLRDARTAHLGKLIFKVLNKEQAPWIRLLQAKYGSLHPWETKKPTNASWVWRALNQTAKQLKMGCRVLVGNGRNMRAAYDPWTQEVPWSRQPRELAMSLMDENLMAADITNNQRWTTERLCREAGSDMAYEISTFPMGAATIEDRWIWWPHPRGTPLVKAIYHSLQRQSEHQWEGWRILWWLLAPNASLSLVHPYWIRGTVRNVRAVSRDGRPPHVYVQIQPGGLGDTASQRRGGDRNDRPGMDNERIELEQGQRPKD
ncbi:uncharacterized protein [Typha angustifolia]|uniref:uncharacterized protein n=1 Tax=Typha angustifolia TaxID=59011 RepID=UPI003C2CCBC8